MIKKISHSKRIGEVLVPDTPKAPIRQGLFAGILCVMTVEIIHKILIKLCSFS